MTTHGEAAHDLILLAWNDLVGLTRGRGVPLEALDERSRKGINWAKAGQALTPFDDIADNPWGPVGEAHMTPDLDTQVLVPDPDGGAPLSFVLCDGLEADGSPWDCCTRGFLRDALQRLGAETGLRLRAATELEFALDGVALRGAPPFSLGAFQAGGAFGRAAVAALVQAGVEPETFEPEFGSGQFEICCAPTEGLAAADRIVVMRETIREVARRHGLHASLSPLTAPGVPGNGAHLHFSFLDAEGRPATHDPAGHGGLSATAAAFAAGVVAHMPALCAITAPAPVSYKRIGPHHWSSGYACLGGSNREAGLRIVEPRLHGSEAEATGLHLEYRPIDSTCSPYLALGMLVHAGLRGIRDGLAPPPLVGRDPDDLSAQEREAQGVVALPGSLEAALEALESDTVAAGWLPPRLREVFVAVKRKELEMTAGLGEPELLAKYANAY